MLYTRHQLSRGVSTALKPAWLGSIEQAWKRLCCAAQADYPLPYWPGVVLSHAAMAVFEVWAR